jgi:hypothetical protein
MKTDLAAENAMALILAMRCVAEIAPLARTLEIAAEIPAARPLAEIASTVAMFRICGLAIVRSASASAG